MRELRRLMYKCHFCSTQTPQVLVHDTPLRVPVSALFSNASSSLIVDGFAPATITVAVNEKRFTSPFQFRGLPKAGPHRGGRVPRRKGKCIIAIDEPTENEIEMRAEEEKSKQMSVTTKKRKVLQKSSSEDENQMSIYSEEKPMLEEEVDRSQQFSCTRRFTKGRLFYNFSTCSK
ncbi:hypothetical protein HHI36_014749 [Cryptolaemus montrouzieri]|uniref:Uncharacterized protein n=1 Tax=Cryptolaemus montrouzieri TaxID=559131 RepID=A0ABD2N4R8_9CUCU